MALIAIAVWNTVENKRTGMLETTLESIRDTVDHSKHVTYLVDNGSEPETGTEDIYERFIRQFPFTLIRAGRNLGTARAINLAWQHRVAGQHALKCDSDIRITEKGWLDKLEQCLERDPKIGIIGLKRPDLIETPWRTDWYKSELHMLPHEPGQDWLIVEKVAHVLGTCQLYSDRLLQVMGYLYQMGKVYGLDDSIAAARCVAAGFYSCFYPHYKLEHTDAGDTDYQKWKEQYAGKNLAAYQALIKLYSSGQKSVYHGPFDE